MKIEYFINTTCDGCQEICFYDGDKYNEANAFGNELLIDIYYPDYDIKETLTKLNNEIQ